MNKSIDLHVHTTASDGTLSPSEVVKKAKELGLAAIGITDHDTADGIEEAAQAGAAVGIEVVPGVEINTDLTGQEVHILGYYFDQHDEVFAGLLRQIRETRSGRLVKMVERARALGMDISVEEVLARAGDAAPGRPHLARVMVEKGYVGSIKEAFDRYLGLDKPVYVERYKISPEEAVQAVLAARGVPVLAHPGLVGNDELVLDLKGVGLQGLEVYHSSHTPEMVEHYLQLARRYGLLITGGSDCHGPTLKEPPLMGTVLVPYQCLKDLQRARDRFWS